jgi:SAM-dependent methyltransferase
MTLVDAMLRPLAPIKSALDFGSGDGWISQQLEATGLVESVTPIDVQRRAKTVREPDIYDGTQLPVASRSFDLVYCSDVLHHCPDPLATLRDVLRCARNWFLIKDHTYRGPLGRWTLSALDEIGNRRFDVPCRYRYQHAWDWSPTIENDGYELVRRIHPAPVHAGPMGWATNRLQFVALWRRVSP